MKYQRRFLAQTVDSFLPKERQKWSLMQLFRGRALVHTCLISCLLNPMIVLFQNNQLSQSHQWLLGLALFTCPLLILWAYRVSGHLRICAMSYLLLVTSSLTYAQIEAHTPHASYWIWYSYFIVLCSLVLGVKTGAAYTFILSIIAVILYRQAPALGHSLGTYDDLSGMLANRVLQTVMIQFCFWSLMIAYDVIRNRAEVRAVMIRFTHEETDRLATVGERMGSMALQLNEQLNEFQTQLLRLDPMMKRSDTKVEDLQKEALELQKKAQSLSEISKVLSAKKIEVLEMVPLESPEQKNQSA